MIRRDKDGTIKESCCHFLGVSLRELAFRDGKEELGLNEYQTRSEEELARTYGHDYAGTIILKPGKNRSLEKGKVMAKNRGYESNHQNFASHCEEKRQRFIGSHPIETTAR